MCENSSFMGLERKLLGGPFIKNHARRWLSSGSVGLQRGCSSAAPPELPPFDYEPKPYNGPRADEVLEKRKRYLGPSLFYYYQKPVSPSTNSLHAICVVCVCVFFGCGGIDLMILCCCGISILSILEGGK